jgi:serine protease inhibitor
MASRETPHGLADSVASILMDDTQPSVDWYISRQQNSLEAVMDYLASKEPQNWTFSPYSLMCCLAMVVAGGTVRTSADRIPDNSKNACDDCKPYCFPYNDASPLPPQAALEALRQFATQLDEVSVCRCANILVQDADPADKQIAEHYKRELSTYFRASSCASAEWQEVNATVQKVTTLPVKILSRAPEGTCVINAVYFKDQWQAKFDEETRAMKFQSSQKSVVVAMMHTTRSITFVKRGTMIAVSLPYQTPGMRAWFVKGADAQGADNAVRTFLPLNFGKTRLRHQRENVCLQLPKFKLLSKFDIKEVLTNKAATSIFEMGNLQKISGDAHEHISKFEQHCMLEVDQNGTVAAAVTAAQATRGARPAPKLVTFGHTFFMLIEYKKTLLFAAKIDCPDALPAPADFETAKDSAFFDSEIQVMDSDYDLDTEDRRRAS